MNLLIVGANDKICAEGFILRVIYSSTSREEQRAIGQKYNLRYYEVKPSHSQEIIIVHYDFRSCAVKPYFITAAQDRLDDFTSPHQREVFSYSINKESYDFLGFA